jgi:acyl-coenzyme A synthetase/AMP-(fatty) acid ligase
LNLFALLDQAAARFGDRGALYLGEQQLHTWGELRDRVLRLASSISRLSRSGSRIAVASENCPEIVELMFAIWVAERVFVPINYKLHPREMEQILDDGGVAQVFASAKIADGLASLTAVPIETIGTDAYESRFGTEPASSTVHRCHMVRAYTWHRMCFAAPGRWYRHRPRSTLMSFSTSANTTPVAAHFSRRPWCSALCRPDAPAREA